MPYNAPDMSQRNTNSETLGSRVLNGLTIIAAAFAALGLRILIVGV